MGDIGKMPLSVRSGGSIVASIFHLPALRA